jgi:hypothetical protein
LLCAPTLSLDQEVKKENTTLCLPVAVSSIFLYGGCLCKEALQIEKYAEPIIITNVECLIAN